MQLRYYAIFNFAEDGINFTFPVLPGCMYNMWMYNRRSNENGKRSSETLF